MVDSIPLELRSRLKRIQGDIERAATAPGGNSLLRRVAQHTLANERGTFAGQDTGNIPGIGLALRMPVAGLNTLGLIAELGQQVAQPTTGAMQAQFGRVLDAPVVGGILQNPTGRAVAETLPVVGGLAKLASIPGMIDAAQAAEGAQNAATGNPFERARAAHDAGEQAGGLATLLSDAVYDPTNAVGLAGKGAQALKMDRVASLLRAVDAAQNVPFEALGKVAKQASGALKRATLLRNVREVVGNVPEDAIPMVGGKRQFGPIPMPEQFGYARGNVPGRPKLGPELLPSQDIGLPPELGPTLPTRGNVPAKQLIPGIGRRGPGLGPELLPSQDIPLPPELGPALPSKGNVPADQLLPRTGRRGGKGLGPPAPRELIPEEAIRPAEERAARMLTEGPIDVPSADVLPQTPMPDFADYQGIPRDQALAMFDSDEIDNLLAIAYGHENGVANAILKRADPVELADRAIERITNSRTKLGLLSKAFPELAEKIAYLPEPNAAMIDDVAEAADEVVQPARMLGGDIAAGGGGMMLVNPLWRAGHGVGRVGKAIADNPVVAHAWEEGKAAQKEANALTAQGQIAFTPREFWSMIKTKTIQHPKNLIGDVTWASLVTRVLQGQEASRSLAPVARDVAARLKQTDPWERLASPVRDELAALGRTGYIPKVGQSLIQSEHKLFSSAQTALGEGLATFLSPTGIAQNAIGLVANTAIGTQRARISGFFNAISDFIQATARQVSFADELGTARQMAAETLLPRWQAAGADIAALAADGRFSPDDVARVAGPQAAEQWRGMVDAIVDHAERRSQFLFGDFSARKGWENLLGGPIPYASWIVRAYPVAFQMALENPVLALSVYHYLQATSQGAGKDGRPSYTAGMIPLETDNPLVGAALQAYMGGKEGTTYLDPIGGITPVGGDLFVNAEDDAGKNWYQQGTAMLARTGLPGVNPLVQLGANLAGLDYKGPNSTNRYEGLTEALALIPGNPELPNVGPSLLRAARGKLSPLAEEAGIPGAKGDKTPSEYDPITRRYAELWKQQTGKTLDDPSDPSGLIAMMEPGNPLMEQARREVLLGNAAKNAASLTSPVTLIGQTKENREYKAAKEEEPYRFDQIQGSSPGVQRLMREDNAAYAKQHPAINTYAVNNKETAAWAVVDQFDQSPRGRWLRMYAPKSYNQTLNTLMVELGLRDASKIAGAR